MPAVFSIVSFKISSRHPGRIREAHGIRHPSSLVFDVTEHRAEKKRCPCGHVTTASFPDGITARVQHGTGIESRVGICSAYECMSGDRSVNLWNVLPGQGSTSRPCVRSRRSSSRKGIEHLRQCDIIHNDETDVSMEGKRRWLHIMSTEELTHHAVDEKRGK